MADNDPNDEGIDLDPLDPESPLEDDAPPEAAESAAEPLSEAETPEALRGRLSAAEELNKRLLDRQFQAPAAQPPSAPPVAEPPRKQPQQSEYNDWDQYTAALTAWYDDQIKRAADIAGEKAYRVTLATMEQQRVTERVRENIAAAAETRPDIMQSVQAVDLLLGGTPAIDAIKVAPDPAAVIDYLAKHPAEAQALAKMDPLSAAVRIGGMSAQVSRPRPVPKATAEVAPIKPVKSGTGGSKNPDLMSDEEVYYQRLRQRRA